VIRDEDWDAWSAHPSGLRVPPERVAKVGETVNSGRPMTLAPPERVATTDISGLANRLIGAQFGPGVPLQPLHPEILEPRRFDYPPGYNIAITPRTYETLGFPLMRSLAEAWDVFAIAIERNIDDFRELDWEIRPTVVKGMSRAQARKRADGLADKISDAQGFWQTPDQQHGWGGWVHGYLDELYKTDAACLYLRKTQGGDLYAVEWVSGSSVRPILDPSGRSPEPPEPAYQQVIRGLPWQDYARDLELDPSDRKLSYDRSILLYDPFWPKVASPYGNPPLMWLILTVQRALNRQVLDASLYAQGTTPFGFWKSPQDWTPHQINEFEEAWNTVSATMEQRTRMRFMPGGAGAGFEPAFKEPTTEGEEWLLHLAYIALKRSPMKDGILRTGSRGLGGAGMAEQQGESANRALKTLAKHVQAQINRVLAEYWSPDLSFVFPAFADPAEDTLKLAQERQIYLDTGVLGVNDVLEDMDRDPALTLTDGLSGRYLKTGQGAITLESVFAPPEPVPPELGGPPDQAPPSGSAEGAPETPSSAPGENTDEQGAGEPAGKIAKALGGKRLSFKGDLATVVQRYLLRSYPAKDVEWVTDSAITWEYDPGVPLASINMARRPGGRNDDKVTAIADAVETGASMDPTVLVDFGEDKLRIADGFHRTLGAEKAGEDKVPAFIARDVPTEYRALVMGDMQDDSASVAGDLRKWERKALASLRKGRSAAVWFESDVIPAGMRASVSQALAGAQSAPDVRAAFAKAGGEPERPLPRTSSAPRTLSATSGGPGSSDRPRAWYATWREP
jgi:hypothetical protein